jgi:DNA (cytosine-5)-methyltransferase 1
MKALSLFANVGIAETYLPSIGVDVVVANELDEKRARFYKHLNPDCDVITGDITDSKIFGEVVRKAKEAKVDLLIATPPCQGMSIAGHNSRYDERNSLIKYAIDVVDIINPKYIFFENVTQQLNTPIIYQGIEIKIPEYIHKRLGDRFVFNSEQVTNAMYYGVPQRRERAIFLLARKDLNKQWNFPTYEKPITLEEAFRSIPDLWPSIKEHQYQNILPENTEEALAFHKWHIPPKHVWRNVECMLYASTGNTAFDNPIHYPKKRNGERVKGYETTYHRLFWDKPAATVTMWNGIMGSQNNVHPGRIWKKNEQGNFLYNNPRVLSIYELLIVSSLPVDWDIPDWASEQLIRFAIGEGIPPLMVKKIVEPIIK